MVLLLLAATLSFTKAFPQSVPDYYRIEVQENGDVVYYTAADDPNPAKFKVSAAFSKQAFDLAAKLDHFKGPLESKLKVAFTGKKTFAFDDGSGKKEVTFNYSEKPDAQELLSLFEHLSNTQQAALDLERIMRFDKLGLMKYLLQIEIMYDHKDLAEPELLVPVLERISLNKSFVNIARDRARILLAKIQTPSKN
jgi:hypothetical protein